MKNLILLFASLLSFIMVKAQVPQGVNYQSAVRNAQGEVAANTNVIFTFSILQADNTTLLYSETHETTTNEFGLVNLVIGEGVPTYLTFESLVWDTPYTVLTTMELDGNTINMGYTSLQSVPYALNAGSASSLLPSATVDPSQLTQQGATMNQVLQFNGTTWVAANLPAGNGGEFDLPFEETDTYNQALFSVNNQNQNAIDGYSTNGAGLYGSSVNGSGVSAMTFANNAAAVYAVNFGAGSGIQAYSEDGTAIAGQSNSGQYPGVFGYSSFTNGVVGQSSNDNMSGVVGMGEGTSANGVKGMAEGNQSSGVKGECTNCTGVYGTGETGVILQRKIDGEKAE